MPTFFNGKLTLIHIPKCAGTSIRQALADYQDEVYGEETPYTFYRDHESYAEIERFFPERWGAEAWNEVTIISSIRHPIERAVSWWNFMKKMNMYNFSLFNNGTWYPFLNPKTSSAPQITQKEYDRCNQREIVCEHVTNSECVKEFSGLSFHDYIHQMTIWGHSGCEYMYCPYHTIAPQAHWLTDAKGNIQTSKLNLFLVEKIGELQNFLPEMGQVPLLNITTKKKKDYGRHLTTASLLLLRKLYAEDFELYETLKNKPVDLLQPFYPEK